MKAIKQSFNSESNKGVFVASIPFLELYRYAKFTRKVAPGEDYTEDSLSNASEEFYQRSLITSHVNNIKSYIRAAILSKQEDIAIFPTSMLLALNTENPLQATNDGFFDINISKGYYIVDGQHRLFAMKSVYEDASKKSDEDSKRIKSYLEQYDFICSILVNYDLWEQSIIFANVNFKQKKVDKSLYYDIYGSQYYDDPSNYKGNYIYVAHTLVKFLNTSDNSPLKGSIKMLGTGNGIISQAFLVESILPLLSSSKGIWHFDPAIEDMKHLSFRHISNEMISYLTSIKNTFPDLWPKEDLKHKSIILKTTGLGALIRLISNIHTCLPQNILDDLTNKNESRITDSYVNYISNNYLTKLITDANRLFGLDGEFSRQSGKASESALYKELKKVIGFF